MTQLAPEIERVDSIDLCKYMSSMKYRGKEKQRLTTNHGGI